MPKPKFTEECYINLTVPLTPSEHMLLRLKAAQAGLAMGRWARMILLKVVNQPARKTKARKNGEEAKA